MNKIILYPTDTVYGLGVDARDTKALLALKELKGRGDDKPFPVAVRDLEMASEYAEFSPLAELLAKKFWPGKLTLVLQGKNLPQELLAHDGSVGIRVPDHPVCFSYPITATSANVSGLPSHRRVSEIMKQFGDKSECLFFDTSWPIELPESMPSTVVDARGSEPIILREGAISKETILDAITRTDTE